MKFFAKACLILGTSFGLVSGAGYLAAHCGLGPAQREESLFELLARYAETCRNSEELEEELEAVNHCVESKKQTCKELIAGKITLSEAAVCFCQAQQDVFEDRAMKWEQFPGVNEHEHRCREVLGWVRGLLCQQPEIADSVLSRLESQFQDIVARHPGSVAKPKI